MTATTGRSTPDGPGAVTHDIDGGVVGVARSESDGEGFARTTA